jgi:hypothetical protein
MPISKILPDGKVEIFNANTGEVRAVLPEELPQYNPKLVSQYQAMKQKQQASQANEQAMMQLGQKGMIDPAEIAKSDPQIALKLAEQGGFQPKPSAKEEEKVDKFKDVEKNLNLLIENLDQVKSRGPVGGGFSEFMSKMSGGASNPDVADYEALRQSMIGGLARTISGEVGVLTDSDIARAEKLLPKISDDPRVAEKKIENLKKLIGNQTGESAQTAPPQSNPVAEQAAKLSQASVVPAQQPGIAVQTAKKRANDQTKLNPLNQFVYDNVAKGPVGDAAEGLLSILYPRLRETARRSAKGEEIGADQLIGAGGELATTAIPFAGPGGAIAKGALSGVVHGATAPGESAMGRAGGAFGEGVLGGALGGLGKVIPKVMHPFKTVGDMKSKAVTDAAGKVVTGDKIFSALEKGAENLSPTVRDGYLKFLNKSAPILKGKELPIGQAVDMAANAGDAYTQAGKVGKAASAKFNDVLSKSLRGEIKTIAPKVASANNLFSKLYNVQSGIGPIAKGAAVSAGVYALLSKLGVGGH